MHGYQLMEFFDRALNFCVAIKKPTTYFLPEGENNATIPQELDGGGAAEAFLRSGL